MTTTTHPTTRPADFDARLIAHLPYLQRLASRFVPRPQRREEIVQETVARALEKWASFREDGSFLAWLRFQFWGVNNPDRPEMKMEMRTLPDGEAAFAVLAAKPEQEGAVELRQTLDRLGAMPAEISGAIISTALGECQTQMAIEQGVTKQAISNRVQRGRAELAGDRRVRRFAVRGRG